MKSYTFFIRTKFKRTSNLKFSLKLKTFESSISWLFLSLTFVLKKKLCKLAFISLFLRKKTLTILILLTSFPILFENYLDFFMIFCVYYRGIRNFWLCQKNNPTHHPSDLYKVGKLEWIDFDLPSKSKFKNILPWKEP